MAEAVRILVVEDNPADARLLRELLREAGGAFALDWVDRLSAACDKLQEAAFDVVLLDLSLPDSRGLETFIELHARAPGLPVVVLTGLSDQETAIDALHEGAQDYRVKRDLSGALLARSIAYAIERQRLRARLEQEARRSEREASRTRFLELAAHELRNPMAGVRAILELLREDIAAGQPAETVRKKVDIAEREVDRVVALLDEVLDAYRAQEGRLVQCREPVDLSEVIEAAIEPFRVVRGPHRFVRQPEDTGPAWVYGDRKRLEDVVRNLISNAVKYSPQGGEVRIRIDRDGDVVKVSVEDQGIGIPPHQVERIFDGFFRADNVAGRGPSGVGLGLFICRKIVEQHGGRMWAESAPGQGATVAFELPAIAALAPADSAAAP